MEKMNVCDVVQIMDGADLVTIKGEKSGRGIEVAAVNLKKFLYPVERISGNKRGGVTLAIDEDDFLMIARLFGYFK